MRRELALVLCLAAASPAFAQPQNEATTGPPPLADLSHQTRGYTYFNRPGATLAQHYADLSVCGALAHLDAPVPSSGPAFVPYPYAGTVEGAIGGAIAMAIIAGVEQSNANRGVGANVENCMVVHGWNVMQLDNAAGRQLMQGSRETLGERLAPLVGAENPPGVLVRRFRNEAVGAAVVINASPTQGERNALSIRAYRFRPPPPRAPATPASAEGEAAKPAGPAPTEMDVLFDSPGVTESAAVTPLDRLSELPADRAVVIVRLVGGQPSQTVRFQRVRPPPPPEPEPAEAAAPAPPDPAAAPPPIASAGTEPAAAAPTEPAPSPTPAAAPSTTAAATPAPAEAEPPIPSAAAEPNKTNLADAFDVTPGQGSVVENRRETVVAFILPAGRWRLAELRNGRTTTALCLGAPAFELAAGDVVFAGTLDLDAGESMGPNLDLAPAQAALAAQADLAGRLRPAPWRNGYLGACSGTFMYSLEFPAAPYEESYRFGTRAAARFPPPAAPPATAPPPPAASATTATIAPAS